MKALTEALAQNFLENKLTSVIPIGNWNLFTGFRGIPRVSAVQRGECLTFLWHKVKPETSSHCAKLYLLNSTKTSSKRLSWLQEFFFFFLEKSKVFYLVPLNWNITEREYGVQATYWGFHVFLNQILYPVSVWDTVFINTCVWWITSTFPDEPISIWSKFYSKSYVNISESQNFVCLITLRGTLCGINH